MQKTSKPLLKYQQDLLIDDSRYIIIEKSRRIGITWTIAGKAVYERLCLDNKRDLWFVSANQKTAKEFINYVTDWAEVFNDVMCSKVIDTTNATSDTLQMPNGSRIIAVSSSTTALRGAGGDVVWDEAAFHDFDEEMFKSAQPVTTWGGKMIICSTHNGSGTLFYRMCQQAKSGSIPYKHYFLDLPRALKDGFALKVPGDHLQAGTFDAINKAFYEQTKAACLSEDAFAQEYLAKPLSATTLITPSEYDSAVVDDNVPDTLDRDKYHPLYFGIDVGRSKDLTVLWVIEQYTNPKAHGIYDRYDYRTVCVKTISNRTIPEQFEMLLPIVSNKHIIGGLIDQGTVGRTLADMICDQFPHVKPIGFTNMNKGVMAERAKGFIATQRVSLPPCDNIREDILSVKRVIGKSGGVSYDGGTSKSHADAFWSLALALHSAEGI